MALMAGLGQAATVAQLVGVDAGGLISMILKAAVTARQNKEECERLARRVFMIAELLLHLQDPVVLRRPEVRRPLEGLGDTLREAHELVMSCQDRRAAYRFVTAGRQAERFRDVQGRIDSYLLVFPFISHIDITGRLDRIYSILLPNDTAMPSSGSQLESPQLGTVVARGEVAFHGDEVEEFTVADLSAATSDFLTIIGRGGFGTVYKGRLADGREVAIKRMEANGRHGEEEFRRELTILSPLRHRHVIRLLGWSVQEEEHRRRRLLSSSSSRKKEKERMLVYEYMNNGTLSEHLHGETSSYSPLRTSWKLRIEILLGVSRAIEYLHCNMVMPVIHRDVKSQNVLLDKSWVPRVADFGVSVAFEEDEYFHGMAGTFGYLDPEYFRTQCLRPTIDIYSFGVLILEVLSGKKAIFLVEYTAEGEPGESPKSLCEWGLDLIEAGEVEKMLDKRPEVPEPTLRQLEAAELVAQTAAQCLHLQGDDRPAMPDVVARLERALELVSRAV